MIRKRVISVAAALMLAATFFQAKASGGIFGSSGDDPKGWHFTPLPMLSYNSALGVQFGTCGDIYNYGQGGKYPGYDHRFSYTLYHYTGGENYVHVQYDSEYLIPGIRFTAVASFQNDPLFHFYGFNGICFNASGIGDYDRSIDEKGTSAFYDYNRLMVRTMFTFQGKINDKLKWVGGFNYWYFKTGDINYKKFDSGNSLYNDFVQGGVLSPSDLKGGRLELKGGVVLDTRDNEVAANKGYWGELYFTGSPDFFGDKMNYLKVSAHWRQYFSVIPDRLVLAYHLGWQQELLGQAPFYMQSTIYTLFMRHDPTDGLGGVNTLRGFFNNRLIGRGYAWTNLEARLTMFRFSLWQQNFSIGFNPFVDLGCVTRPYKVDELANLYGMTPEQIKDNMGPRIRGSAGFSIPIGWNKDFILTLEGAKPFRESDGHLGLYFVLNYLF